MTTTDARDREIDRLKAENQALSEYAFEATKAITGLTVGGSEFFSGKLPDGRYKADLAACVEHLDRWRRRDQEVRVSLTAENKRLREALEQIIEMNVQYCIDRYGDAKEAEHMACVRTARAALEGEGKDHEQA